MSRKAASQQTRTDILDAAWDLISEQGAEVSMSLIAEAAGVSRQAVHLHFGTRGGMLTAMVRRVDERLKIKERMFAAFEIEDPEGRLDKVISVWLDFVQDIYPVANDLIRLRETDADAANAWEDRMADLRSWLTVLVRSLKSDGALAPEWTGREATEYLWAAFSVQIWGLLVHDCQWRPNRSVAVLRSSIKKVLLAQAGGVRT